MKKIQPSLLKEKRLTKKKLMILRHLSYNEKINVVEIFYFICLYHTCKQ